MARTASELMPGVPLDWVDTYFPVDRLLRPVRNTVGARTVFIQLNTLMFARMHNDPEQTANVDELAPKVTRALAQIVSTAIDGVLEVECFVPGGKPEWISLVPARA